MAIDEAILCAVAAGLAPPTLRLYAWAPPCLSLGRAQPLADVDLEALRAAGFDLVRRPTGGKAILHADELTYSVIAPESEPRVAGGVIESYRRLSRGLVCALEESGYLTSRSASKQNAVHSTAPSASKSHLITRLPPWGANWWAAPRCVHEAQCSSTVPFR